MARLTINERQANRLLELLKDNQKELRKQLSICVNKAGKTTQVLMSRKLREELAIKSDVAKGAVRQKGFASQTNLRLTVEVPKGKRIALKEFSPKQNKSGTAYKIARKGKRSFVAGAFMGPKPGLVSIKTRGHVFKRVGKEKLPIIKLFGPSPWGALVKFPDRTKEVAKKSRAELAKQIRRRIRYLELKASGGLRGKQPT